MMKKMHPGFRRLALLALAVSGAAWTQAADAAACFPGKPLASLTVTSPFGPRYRPAAGASTYHKGVDFRAKEPLPVFAVDSGIVRGARFERGGGNTLELFTDHGIVVQYLHMSSFDPGTGRTMAMGDRVATGAMMGKTGNTGEFTNGPHLHFVTKVNGSTSVDPMQFLCDGATTPTAPVIDPAIPAGQMDAFKNVDQGNGVMGPNVAATSTFPTMDDMSVRDFLYSETHKRFMNPQWYQEMEHLGPTPESGAAATGGPAAVVIYPKIHHLRELNSMLALRNLMAVERSDHKESIEARLAALRSIDAKDYSDKIQAMTRNNVGKTK